MPGYFLPPRLVQLMHLRPARTREMVGGREGGCLGNNYDDNYVDRCCLTEFQLRFTHQVAHCGHETTHRRIHGPGYICLSEPTDMKRYHLLR